MRNLLACILLIASPGLATAQAVELGTSILTTANASVLPGGCSVMDGGGGSTEATASCAAMGSTAAGSAQSSLSSSTSGGSATAFAQASATSSGGPSNLTATGQGGSSALVTWEMLSNTHYSLRTTTSGTGVARLEGPGPLPPSGILSPGFYTLRAQGTALAQAQDSNGAETVTAGPHTGTADVTFASVGSLTLILGTVTSGGSGAPGLLVEAIDGGAVVASTSTGDDGSYLLPDLPCSVVLRVSDPEGILATQFSGLLVPPATFDADLSAVVPALSAPFAVALGLGLALCARTMRRGRRSSS
jgi:hypothetical protein